MEVQWAIYRVSTNGSKAVLRVKDETTASTFGIPLGESLRFSSLELAKFWAAFRYEGICNMERGIEEFEGVEFVSTDGQKINGSCDQMFQANRVVSLDEAFHGFFAKPHPEKVDLMRRAWPANENSPPDTQRDNQTLQRTGPAIKRSWFQRLFGRGPDR